jgi:hypothetical protein
MNSILTKKQVKTLRLTEDQCKKLEEMGYEGVRTSSSFKISYDDECNNKHNTFAITGTIYDKPSCHVVCTTCGCLHEEFALIFPEYKHLLKWHHMNSDGPLHYLPNTMYLAGNRDYNGRLKGEVSHTQKQLKFKDPKSSTPVKSTTLKWLEQGLHLEDTELLRVDHTSDTGYKYAPSYYFANMEAVDPDVGKWHKAPFKSEEEAFNFLHDVNHHEWEIVETPTEWSEGKERELDSARRSAVWEDATDEQLCLPKEELKALLEARLPALIEEFRKDVEALGFVY